MNAFLSTYGTAITVVLFALIGIWIVIDRSRGSRRLKRAYRELRDILARLPGTICATVRPWNPDERIFGLMAMVSCPPELDSAEASRRLYAVRYTTEQFALARGLRWVAQQPWLLERGGHNYRILIALRYPE